MSLVVNNNSSAFGIWANFSANSTNMKKAMGHLSTGVKQVVDNPSGVGISERMRSQARNTASARGNVDNAISMLQTADSWMQKINDMLGRMSELAIEAGDGTKTATDKDNIQTEFAQLQDEIHRVTSSQTSAAKFNGLYLFRGGNGNAVVGNSAVGSMDLVDSGNIEVQIGADANQTVELTLNDLSNQSTNKVGTITSYEYSANGVDVATISQTSVTWASVINTNEMSVTSDDVVGKLAKAIDFISNSRATNGAQQNRLENTRSALLSYEDNLRAAESKVRDIDMARESTQLAKFQILNQVSNAMLAQANQLPGQVLQLVG